MEEVFFFGLLGFVVVAKSGSDGLSSVEGPGRGFGLVFVTGGAVLGIVGFASSKPSGDIIDDEEEESCSDLPLDSTTTTGLVRR